MPLRPLRRLWGAPAARRARIPDGARVYAVGDIHGRLDCLLAMEALITADLAAQPIPHPIVILLGDYVDRGPDSRGVLQHLLADMSGIERHLLRGNHEDMLANVLADPGLMPAWQEIGGTETLLSYGVDPPTLRHAEDAAQTSAALARAMPTAHLALLERLETVLVVGDYCFVHAGLRPGVPLERQRPSDLLWIRDEFLDHTGSHGCVVVHGHTPVDAMDVRDNRINIDTGAYATGRLTCVVLEGEGLRRLETAL